MTRPTTPWLLGGGALLVVGLLAAATGSDRPAELPPLPEGQERATFAGGCFWCMEPPFDKLDGVISTTSGYTGGEEPDPTYKEVSYGRTGHAEAVEVRYDPEKISYRELLDVFWRNIDPTTADRQFCDRGRQYRTAIYTHDEEQMRLALETRREIEESGILGQPIVTEIVPAGPFYPAEEYHQDFYLKNPEHYHRYRVGCGRDRTLERIWGVAPEKG
ncbi:MAG: peptide-methionine (S)-S-oxide reductase MsrA [Thermoanaerobaculia bacterium]|nr:peptide-methionine (S)-S-oxide reductase MsrA [Thermoanaerobaculia bacterium]